MAGEKTVDHEEQVPEEQGGIVTTVRTAVPKNDPDLNQAIVDAGGDPETVTGKQKPAEEPKPKVVPAKKDDDDEGEFDVKTLTPEAQGYVNRLNKERRLEKKRLQSKLDSLQDQVNSLSQRRQEPEQVKRETTTGKPVKPKYTEFKNAEDFDAADEQYQEDLATWKYNELRKEEVARDKAAKQKEEDEQLLVRFNGEQEKFIKANPDYEDVMDKDIDLSPIMFGHIIEEGPWLGYHFGKNEEESEKIRLMPDEKQERYILKMIAKHELEQEKEKEEEKPVATKVKEKPEPIVPGTGRRMAEQKDKSQMNFKEREALMRKRNPSAFNYDD